MIGAFLGGVDGQINHTDVVLIFVFQHPLHGCNGIRFVSHTIVIANFQTDEIDLRGDPCIKTI